MADKRIGIGLEAEEQYALCDTQVCRQTLDLGDAGVIPGADQSQRRLNAGLRIGFQQAVMPLGGVKAADVHQIVLTSQFARRRCLLPDGVDVERVIDDRQPTRADRQILLQIAADRL